MRLGTARLVEVLKGSFNTRIFADVFYGATRTLEDVPLTNWELRWNSESEIKSAGDVTVAYSDDIASSLSPNDFADILAPFGQQLSIRMEVTAGDFSETIQLGHYRISAVPEARDEWMNVTGRDLVVGSMVRLTLEDRLLAVKRSGFRFEQSPPSLLSCWSEIQRLTGMQVVRSLPDKDIPASVVYAADQGGRLKAVQALATVLGGVAYMTSDGAVSVLPDAWGAKVADLVLGEDGSILDVGNTMESDGVYNVVVGSFEDADRNPIVSVAELVDGPYGTASPFGEYTRYYSSPFVKTQAQADSAVAAVLSQVSSAQVYRVPVQCLVNPLIEDGDVIGVQRPGGDSLVGRVVNHKLGASNVMWLEMDVKRAL